MILQNNSFKTETKVSLKAQLYTLYLMILQIIHAKATAKVSLKAQTLHTLFDDIAKNSCKS